jgi:type IV pilus assembly protein PilY1
MAYFGAADGMLHAVCAGTGGTTASQSSSVCPNLGTELWAFMPRVQLPLLPSNNQRIDGSVRVVDAFGDFTTTTGTGTKSWRTILLFQTGFSRAAVAPAAKAPPAAYAIDVTDPASPVLLWEYSTPSSPAANDFGTGMRVAAGPALVNGASKYMAWLETNNGGSAATTAPGVVLQALDLDTGTSAWSFTSAYPVTSVPYQAVPGGAVGVDLVRNGFFTDIVFGDLYGRAWRLDAATGTSKTGSPTTPLFQFAYAASSDKHPIGAPPAIYSDGTTQYAAFVAGGYADQADAATTWSSGTHSLAVVKVNASSYPVLDSASTCVTCNLRVFRNLDAGTKAYAQPTIVGNQLFAVSDASDVNSVTYGTTGTPTGHILAVNGLDGNESFTSYGTNSVYGGASSVTATTINGSIVIIGSSSDKQVKLGTAATTGTGSGIGAASRAQGPGTTVDLDASVKVRRLLWLRIE